MTMGPVVLRSLGRVVMGPTSRGWSSPVLGRRQIVLVRFSARGLLGCVKCAALVRTADANPVDARNDVLQRCAIRGMDAESS
jgi:hypothetical protein